MLFKDEQSRSVTGRRPFYECMHAHPHELSFNLYQRDDEYKEPHDDAAETLQSLTESQDAIILTQPRHRMSAAPRAWSPMGLGSTRH